MYALKFGASFKKDWKRVRRGSVNIEKEADDVFALLQSRRQLPSQYREHSLKGRFSGCMECHLRPDVLLIYQVDTSTQEIYLVRIGSHAELFG